MSEISVQEVMKSLVSEFSTILSTVYSRDPNRSIIKTSIYHTKGTRRWTGATERQGEL